MTTKKTAVRVTILGDEYALRSERSAEETRAVAEYVDAAIRQVMASGSVVETHKAAILACLRVTGELFQARDEMAALVADIRSVSQEIRPWLPPAKRHD